MVDGEAPGDNEPEGEMSDYVCRSIGYFLEFLTMTVPVLSLVIFAWRVSK